MKIVYCLNSISGIGGIDIVTVAKANALAELPDNEIFICVSDFEDNEMSNRVSSKVKVIDLDIDYFKDDRKSKFHHLKGIVLKRRLHKKRLSEILWEIKPDIVISAGQHEKYFLPEIKGDWKTIREIHFSSNYRILISQSNFSKLKAKFENIYDFKFKIKNYDRIVLLTEEDRQLHWQGNRNVSVVPNLLTSQSVQPSRLENKRVISIGRLEYQKNFISLIKAFSKVIERHPDWTLEIYGEGSRKKSLQEYIDKNNLSKNIFLKGFTIDPMTAMRESSIFALSSVFEGFGLVLIEAMACGVPVVSYDCPCGPKDIVTDGTDGFLIGMGDEEKLAEKINFLIENPTERKKMGLAALEKAKKFSKVAIVARWMSLFKNLTSPKACD